MNVILADGTSFPIDRAGFEPSFTATCETRDDYIALWDSLSHDALSEIDLYDDGKCVARFKNARLASTQAVPLQNDAYSVSFYFTAEKMACGNPEALEALSILMNGE